MAVGVAQVDTVQAQQRQACRVGPRQQAVMTLECFMQAPVQAQGTVAVQLPVIEVAGNDHRGVSG
ncbi:hypothetical protein D3C78_1403570 [compost metagenome]